MKIRYAVATAALAAIIPTGSATASQPSFLDAWHQLALTHTCQVIDDRDGPAVVIYGGNCDQALVEAVFAGYELSWTNTTTGVTGQVTFPGLP